ncbi:MAG: aminoacyl-tRNA hydrolase [Candidatus Saccharimonadales bacterium]
MKLILAQGNPGAEYANTRHNVGFLALDHYTQAHALTFQSKPKFNADIAEMTVDGEKILLAKPMTFYNETGVSARAIADFYKIYPEDVLVLHDDLALPLGTVRTREKGSDAGNNGIRSLNSHLGEHYKRIRIGIWTAIADERDTATFVLGVLSASEQAMLVAKQPTIAHIIDSFIARSFKPTSYHTADE